MKLEGASTQKTAVLAPSAAKQLRKGRRSCRAHEARVWFIEANRRLQHSQTRLCRLQRPVTPPIILSRHLRHHQPPSIPHPPLPRRRILVPSAANHTSVLHNAHPISKSKSPIASAARAAEKSNMTEETFLQRLFRSLRSTDTAGTALPTLLRIVEDDPRRPEESLRGEGADNMHNDKRQHAADAGEEVFEVEAG
ncbi:hypothetical protein HO133_010349 [Letharia lupina]|uniref:Uncharacterized protein n=1 Tax=Letharia lupina TaxID=560253 RepID=A0A8H6CKE7_9LECA|nr:uncharacterized protein HO133_010349 [Letharia lupina]KAF6225152.1 hypothetical protein HO133_010349 [Letharia lupina]